MCNCTRHTLDYLPMEHLHAKNRRHIILYTTHKLITMSSIDGKMNEKGWGCIKHGKDCSNNQNKRNKKENPTYIYKRKWKWNKKRKRFEKEKDFKAKPILMRCP